MPADQTTRWHVWWFPGFADVHLLAERNGMMESIQRRALTFWLGAEGEAQHDDFLEGHDG